MSTLNEKLKSIRLFDLTKFKKIKILSSSKNSLVVLAGKGKEYVVIKYFIFDDDSYAEKYIEREFTCLSKCQRIDKKYVIELLGISYTDLDGNSLKYPILIQSYADHGSLHDLIEESKTNPEKLPILKQMFLICEIAKGIEWLHYNHIVHRDLKPENILLDKNDNPLLADFGCCRLIEEINDDNEEEEENDDEKKGTQLGTFLFEAPEVFDDEVTIELMPKTDVFSYGMIVYNILTGKTPYQGVLKRINMITIPEYLKKNDKRFNLPDEIPSYFKQLMHLLWNQNPHERPSFSEIVSIFNAGIAMPSILSDENHKKNYFRLISASPNLNKKKLNRLCNEFEIQNNNPKLSSVVLLFLADFMNDDEAQTKIGIRYTDGEILEQDRNLGFAYFQKAANQNNKEAIFYLGVAYKYGIGCNKNIELSNDMLQRSSDLGFDRASRYLTNKEIELRIDKRHAPLMIIIGSWVTGKTTFLNKLIDMYDSSYTTNTIGVIETGMVCENDQKEKFFLRIRDTQGLEKFGPLANEAFRGANLTIVMFDIHHRESFERIDEWISLLRNTNGSSKLIIVGNKMDLERHVTKIEAIEKANSYDSPYFEISALRGDNIEHVYHEIVKTIQKYKLKNVREVEGVDLGAENESKFTRFFRNHC